MVVYACSAPCVSFLVVVSFKQEKDKTLLSGWHKSMTSPWLQGLTTSANFNDHIRNTVSCGWLLCISVCSPSLVPPNGRKRGIKCWSHEFPLAIPQEEFQVWIKSVHWGIDNMESLPKRLNQVWNAVPMLHTGNAESGTGTGTCHLPQFIHTHWKITFQQRERWIILIYMNLYYVKGSTCI